MSSYNELLSFVDGKIKGLQDCLDTLADRDSATNHTNKNLADAKADCTSKASTLESNVATYVTNDKSGDFQTFNAFCKKYEERCTAGYVLSDTQEEREVASPVADVYSGVSSRYFKSSMTVISLAGTGVEVNFVGISAAFRGFCFGPTFASFSGSAFNASAFLVWNELKALQSKVQAVESAALSMKNVVKAIGDEDAVMRARMRSVATKTSGLSMYFV